MVIAAILFAFIAGNAKVDGDTILIQKHDKPGQYHVIPAHRN